MVHGSDISTVMNRTFNQRRDPCQALPFSSRPFDA
jgi:hypothetical protein